MKEGTYEIVVYCDNCGYKGKISIPKGSKVQDELCPTCGCPNISRSSF